MKAIMTLLVVLALVGCGDATQVKFPGTSHPEAVKKVLCDGKLQYAVLPDECK